jgi:hypothetical protein
MNLADVMDQLAERLDSISGLNAFPFPPDHIDAPAAIVDYPEEVTFDETYGRGMDRMRVPVVLVVARRDERSTRDELAAFCNGSGARSVKQVLESGDYTAFDTIRVVDINIDPFTIAGVEYVGGLFTLDIAGPGSS